MASVGLSVEVVTARSVASDRRCVEVVVGLRALSPVRVWGGRESAHLQFDVAAREQHAQEGDRLARAGRRAQHRVGGRPQGGGLDGGGEAQAELLQTLEQPHGHGFRPRGRCGGLRCGFRNRILPVQQRARRRSARGQVSGV
jgi:hypothetical protein